MYTVLTPAGLDRLRRAAPIHLAGVQEYWLSKFSDAELRELHDLLNRLAAEPADSEETATAQAHIEQPDVEEAGT
jgi:hypothetical protein